MGNLEKAGVLVVVALLAVILVVAFMNNPESGSNAQLDAHKNLVAGAGEVLQHGQPQTQTPPSGQSGTQEVPKPKDPPANENGSDEILVPRSKGGKPATQEPEKKNDDSAKGAPVKPDGKDRESSTPPSDSGANGGKNEAAPPATSPSGYPKKVKVTAKESTLWAIAVHEYGGKTGPKMIKAIQSANPGVRVDALKVGEELTLPAPPSGSDVAVKGDASKSDASKTDAAKADGKTDSTKAATSRGAKKPATSTEKKPRNLPFLPH